VVNKMNKWIGIGRLTRDPEVRYTQAGKAVASFSLAVDSGFGDNKRTDFINVTCWDKMAEMVGNNLIKGIKVLVEGRLQISNYEKDGVKKQSTEIVAINIEFLEKKEDKKRENKTDMTGFGTDVNNDIDF
jgi:single-strand DNA-binding protein